MNLLTNAVKYTNEGGHIWLSVQQEGDKAVLRVRDTGLGITPAFLPHIFDLFSQAERTPTGRRAGWASDWLWCNDWWKCTRERSQVSSTLGQGSEFVVQSSCGVGAPPKKTRQPAETAGRLAILASPDRG